MTPTDEKMDLEFMKEALREAGVALEEGEVPIGAVAVRDGTIIGMGHNRRRALDDITAHAEMMCLRSLKPDEDGFLDLSDVTIYSTLEPCAMCSGAMIHYGCGRVVYGAKDLRLGACGTALDILNKSDIEIVSGIMDDECRQILYDFFEKELGEKSKVWEDIELE